MKKSRGGNKRSQINEKKKPKGAQQESIGEVLSAVRDTTNIEEIIELTHHQNTQVRLKATQQMCPCRVQCDQPDFWNRLFDLAQDEDDAVRAQVLHNMCDGSPEGYEEQVINCLEIFNRDPNTEIRRKAHKVMASYLRTGDWNVL